MKPVLYWPLRAARQNIHMAQFFIDAAKDSERLVATFHYITAAAIGLWSAIDIYIKKVAPGDKKPSAEYPPLRGSATDWFKKNERLVNSIRHSRVHYAGLVEIAARVPPAGDPPSPTSLIVVEGEKIQDIPITEVISRLEAVCHRVNDLISNQTDATPFDFR